MRVSALAFAALLSVVSAKKINMHCDFAADHTGMVQEAYCCRDFVPARGNPKANEAMDCMYTLRRLNLGYPANQSGCTGDNLKVPQMCEDQSRPACCYAIVSCNEITLNLGFTNTGRPRCRVPRRSVPPTSSSWMPRMFKRGGHCLISQLSLLNGLRTALESDDWMPMIAVE